MPDTRLILHVKGTEAETAELPKEEVRAAISEGRITRSQLIWIPSEYTWKPVKELPELLPVPVERLILHVKGTEAETTELPKADVRAAISQGTITHSQLIWVPGEQAWKQVRELPDLLPGERLILHVKGTEAETKELPKQAIKAALSQGQITHSQLIWSSKESTWKQVRELPELLPTQKLAPAPSRAALQQVPRIAEAIIPESPTGPVDRAVMASSAPPKVRAASGSGGVPKARVAVQAPPRVRVASAQGSVATPRPAIVSSEPPQEHVPAESASVPQVRVATAATPQVRVASATPSVRAAEPVQVRSTAHLKVQEEDHAHPLKWLCIGLGIVILLVAGGNYFLVDQPLVSNLSQTPYSNVTVYAHLGAYVQPNVVVIHVPRSSSVTAANVTDFLVSLARSTPQDPITNDLYARVALTSGWKGQYTFSGYSWKELGDMTHDSEGQRKEFIMAQICDASGQSLMPESTLSEAAQQAKRDQVWEDFVTQFTSGN